MMAGSHQNSPERGPPSLHAQRLRGVEPAVALADQVSPFQFGSNTGTRQVGPNLRERCSTQNLLSTTGRWMRIPNATATPPLVYRMEHKANDGMRKLNSSLQPWPEYLMWQWHPLKGCKLPIATHDDFCQALEALQLSRIFIVSDSMQWNMAPRCCWRIWARTSTPSPPTRRRWPLSCGAWHFATAAQPGPRHLPQSNTRPSQLRRSQPAVSPANRL